jgi:hypothetical protein
LASPILSPVRWCSNGRPDGRQFGDVHPLATRRHTICDKSGSSRARLMIAVPFSSGILFQTRRDLGLPSSRSLDPTVLVAAVPVIKRRTRNARPTVWSGRPETSVASQSRPWSMVRALAFATFISSSVHTNKSIFPKKLHLLNRDASKKPRARRTERGVWNHKTLPVHPWSR